MAEGKNNLVANQHIVPESRESIITTAIKKTKQKNMEKRKKKYARVNQNRRVPRHSLCDDAIEALRYITPK